MNEMDRQQRLAVAKASDDLRRGKIDRRKFLRICAQAGFSFTSLYFLGGRRAMAASTKTPAAGIEAGIDQQNFLKDVGRTFAGKTLRIVGENTGPSKATIELMKQEFIPLTGINVEWETLPLDQALAKVSRDTARRVGQYDIFYWDQAWLGRFVRDAADPRELLLKKDLAYPGYDFDDFIPSLVERVASYKGDLAGIPYDIPIFIMTYRKDVFEELGLSLPTTMDEYMEVVKALHGAKGPNFYGTTGQWKSGHYSLETAMTAWLWAHGGSIFGADERPTIDDERAVAAMEYMMELKKYMSPDVTSWDWFDEAKSFSDGLVGIQISWGEVFPGFDNPDSSKIVGLAEAAPCPKEINLRSPDECGFDEKPGISHQGGSCLAISKYSKNIDAAWIFLQWATSSDITTRASLLGGGSSPIRMSNYADPRIKEKAKVVKGTTRHFDVTLDAIKNRMGTEPHLPAWSRLSVKSFAVELGKMTTGKQGIKETLDKMAKAAAVAAAKV